MHFAKIGVLKQISPATAFGYAGVRCCSAPHDLPIRPMIWDDLDYAIRLRDKVLLTRFERAIGNDWIEDEVSAAIEGKRERQGTMFFPIRHT